MRQHLPIRIRGVGVPLFAGLRDRGIMLLDVACQTVGLMSYRDSDVGRQLLGGTLRRKFLHRLSQSVGLRAGNVHQGFIGGCLQRGCGHRSLSMRFLESRRVVAHPAISTDEDARCGGTTCVHRAKWVSSSP